MDGAIGFDAILNSKRGGNYLILLGAIVCFLPVFPSVKTACNYMNLQ